MRSPSAAFLAPLLLALAGCTAPASAGPGAAVSRADADAVRGAVEGLIAATNVGDADLVIGFYAEDAVLVPPQGPQLTGRDAIRSYHQRVFQEHGMAVTVRSDETLISGELAVDRGLVQGGLFAKESGETTEVHDRYVMVLRRDATGRWRVLRVMWAPAAPDTPGA